MLRSSLFLWNVPEKGADDGLRYKWTLNGGPEDGTPIEEVNLGTGSSAALPALPVLLAGSYTVKCEVDDSSSDSESGVAAPDLGNRNDGPATHTVVIQVVATDWEAGQGIGSHPKTDEDGKQIEPVEWIEDGQLKVPAPGSETKAVPGEAIELEVNAASDWDAWTRDGIGSGIGADGPLTYKWSATGGKFRVKAADGTSSEVDEASGLKATWIAPAPDPDAGNGEGETYTITCTIDDGEGARTTPPNESGSHDDEALKREVSIEVVPSYWAPEDKGIGFHPTLDENDVPVKPYQWNEDGRITAPIDQRVEDAPEEKVVLPGESVTATIEAAQDWDTLTTLEGKSIARDEALTYVWSSGGVGHFLVKDEDGNPVLDADGKPTHAATATGRSVTWVAPDDVEEDTEVELKCTIDDGEGERAEPHGGTRDDEKLERAVKVKVVLPKVTFTQLDGSDIPESGARSVAGGVAVDGVHDFTILGTAKLGDGTLPPAGTEFKLSFENNKGHDYSGDDISIWPIANWKIEDIKNAKFVTIDSQGNQKLVEELTVETDENGEFPVKVLSSDIISTDIKIKAKRPNGQGQDVDAGEQICDFAQVVSIRRFSVSYPEEGDKGWIFESPKLASKESTTPAKIYLKSMKKLSDKEKDGNWHNVNGHRLFFYVSRVTMRDGGSAVTDATALKNYAIVMDGPNAHSDPQGTTVIKITSGDGAAQAWLKAKSQIKEVQRIYVKAADLSQWEE